MAHWYWSCVGKLILISFSKMSWPEKWVIRRGEIDEFLFVCLFWKIKSRTKQWQFEVGVIAISSIYFFLLTKCWNLPKDLLFLALNVRFLVYSSLNKARPLLEAEFFSHVEEVCINPFDKQNLSLSREEMCFMGGSTTIPIRLPVFCPFPLLIYLSLEKGRFPYLLYQSVCSEFQWMWMNSEAVPRSLFYLCEQ